MNKLVNLINRFIKPLSFYTSADPVTSEIEQVSRFEQHLGKMIRARWIFSGTCLTYALVLTSIIGFKSDLFTAVRQFALPLFYIFFGTVLSNIWYQYSYHWLSHLRGLRQLHVLLDVVLVIFVIHYTGGVISWVWIICPLIVLESALVFDQAKDTWGVALFAICSLGWLFSLETRGIIPQVKMPFYDYAQGYGENLVWVFFSWIAFITICTASVGTYFMRLHKSNQENLKEKVIRDHLTGLYNRKHFFHSLQSEIERAHRFNHLVSLLLIDLDGFKAFNDTFGHLEGDKLLQGVAGILKHNIRADCNLAVYNVDIPFRYGGDEFIIILPESSPSYGVMQAELIRKKIALEGVLSLAERIRNQVQTVFTGKSKITVSIGVAAFPLHGNSVETVVQAADTALYKAKKEGRNAVFLAEF
ncbi:MAG: GGDEF domain-containing protein [Candidatus Schekmanbacteria bacterium]|nr:GGDEF domain-containing protein [Candidatus Schekmanbacteria bacterium]